MKKEISQLLLDVIKKAVQLKESTGISVDVHLSLSFYMVDFYMYANRGDLSYTHSESVHLDDGDADEKLNDIWDLLHKLEKEVTQSVIINNQLN